MARNLAYNSTMDEAVREDVEKLLQLNKEKSIFLARMQNIMQKLFAELGHALIIVIDDAMYAIECEEKESLLKSLKEVQYAYDEYQRLAVILKYEKQHSYVKRIKLAAEFVLYAEECLRNGLVYEESSVLKWRKKLDMIYDKSRSEFRDEYSDADSFAEYEVDPHSESTYCESSDLSPSDSDTRLERTCVALSNKEEKSVAEMRDILEATRIGDEGVDGSDIESNEEAIDLGEEKDKTTSACKKAIQTSSNKDSNLITSFDTGAIDLVEEKHEATSACDGTQYARVRVSKHKIKTQIVRVRINLNKAAINAHACDKDVYNHSEDYCSQNVPNVSGSAQNSAQSTKNGHRKKVKLRKGNNARVTSWGRECMNAAKAVGTFFRCEDRRFSLGALADRKLAVS